MYACDQRDQFERTVNSGIAGFEALMPETRERSWQTPASIPVLIQPAAAWLRPGRRRVRLLLARSRRIANPCGCKDLERCSRFFRSVFFRPFVRRRQGGTGGGDRLGRDASGFCDRGHDAHTFLNWRVLVSLSKSSSRLCQFDGSQRHRARDRCLPRSQRHHRQQGISSRHQPHEEASPSKRSPPFAKANELTGNHLSALPTVAEILPEPWPAHSD